MGQTWTPVLETRRYPRPLRDLGMRCLIYELRILHHYPIKLLDSRLCFSQMLSNHRNFLVAQMAPIFRGTRGWTCNLESRLSRLIGKGASVEHVNLQVLKHDIEYHANRCRVPRKTKKNSKTAQSLLMVGGTPSDAMDRIEVARRKTIGGHSPRIIDEIVNSLLHSLNLPRFLQRQ